MATYLRILLRTCLASTVLALTALAQGVEVKDAAAVLYGSASTTTQPAVIDFDEVKKKTPEWKTIRSEGVRPDSARYQLLMSDLDKRLRRLCRQVAQDQGRDCVIRKGDIKQDNGLTVEDLTDALVQAVESDTAEA